MQISKLGRRIIFGSMALGAFFVLFAAWFITEATLSKTWPVTDGIITNTPIKGVIYRPGDPIHRTLLYNVELEYTYQIDGTEYRNSQISLGEGDTLEGPFNTRSEAWDWIKASEYQSGNSILIYVHPKNPQRAIIRAGINIGTIVPLILGLLMLSPVLLFKLNKQKPDADAFNQIHQQK
ncbi:DUF3592 domain-containing protein [Marinicella sp. W31]|uniref:DUF3592 domain-containing protein n=1 Tax=Marinicella sp. W31 TaxID=3023713 RepID=UPI0037570B8A